MKRSIGTLALLIAVMVASISVAEAQTFSFRRTIYSGRVVNATSDSTNDINYRDFLPSGIQGFKYGVPDSVRLVSAMRGDSVKFTASFQSLPYSSKATSPYRYTNTSQYTITRANPSGTSTTDSVHAAAVATNLFRNYGKVGVKIAGAAGNATLVANANQVDVFLEFYFTSK